MADFNISIDYLEEIASKIDLSKDLTNAKVADLNSIGEAVFFKLTYHDSDITEFIENTQIEIKSYVLDLLKGRGIEIQDVRQVLQFLAKDSFESKNALLSIKALKKIKIFNETHGGDFSDLDPDEFCGGLLSWVTILNRIRVSGDLIPMVTRAVYQEKVRNAIRCWKANRNSTNRNSEEFWQKELGNNLDVLERIIGAKILLISEQAHFGGQCISGRGAKIPDFALEHISTNNLIIVEIKTPGSKLLGRKYRNDVYGLSAELSGAISQVLVQRNQIMNSFYEKKYRSESSFEVHKPKCIIIIGDAGMELKGKTDKCRSFELSRSAVEPDVVIKTFDELYESYISFNDANGISDHLG